MYTVKSILVGALKQQAPLNRRRTLSRRQLIVGALKLWAQLSQMCNFNTTKVVKMVKIMLFYILQFEFLISRRPCLEGAPKRLKKEQWPRPLLETLRYFKFYHFTNCPAWICSSLRFEYYDYKISFKPQYSGISLIFPAIDALCSCLPKTLKFSWYCSKVLLKGRFFFLLVLCKIARILKNAFAFFSAFQS